MQPAASEASISQVPATQNAPQSEVQVTPSIAQPVAEIAPIVQQFTPSVDVAPLPQVLPDMPTSIPSVPSPDLGLSAVPTQRTDATATVAPPAATTEWQVPPSISGQENVATPAPVAPVATSEIAPPAIETAAIAQTDMKPEVISSPAPVILESNAAQSLGPSLDSITTVNTTSGGENQANTVTPSEDNTVLATHVDTFLTNNVAEHDKKIQAAQAAKESDMELREVFAKHGPAIIDMFKRIGWQSPGDQAEKRIAASNGADDASSPKEPTPFPVNAPLKQAA